ncbi:histidine kinase [Nonomuraea ferruginea]|uniref:histidine kinase n=1 Tax=Nonomuraea ferruginea TaxID=46174 RepID=A0ABT4T9V9_9ACTN|nr:histidine kinase [Nonomuraea ferruginea]MDA0646298.1 histidine kinase [Nonomuraea ferruginea]
MTRTRPAPGDALRKPADRPSAQARNTAAGPAAQALTAAGLAAQALKTAGPAARALKTAAGLAAKALRTAAGLVDLALNAVTGLAALALLALVTVSAALEPVAGPLAAPLARSLGLAHRLAAFQRRWAGRVLPRDGDTESRNRDANRRDHDTDIRDRDANARNRDANARDRDTDSSNRDTHGRNRDTNARGGVGRHRGAGASLQAPHGTRRTMLWLAVHSVTGPAPLAVMWAMLAALDHVFFRLRPMENSSLSTFALSMSVASIAVIILVSVPLFRTGQARLARLLLDTRPAPDARIRELAASRAAVLDAREAEVRRIERDLHDGAQAKLIAIRMHLALARGCRDPDELHRAIDEAREAAGEALTDLRDLVRGIHPPVLADRGLAGAIEASALLCPMPVELHLDLPGRLPPPVESAVYFAAAEALTNATKHSGASHAWVRLRHVAGVLRVSVGDDGHGGARLDRGTGLRGIENRLSAFDGSLTVSSPPGGPTELTMELPCALSSPKISHC